MKPTQPKLKPFTVRLLRRIQEKILDEPKQFFMRVFFTDFLGATTIPNCGTAACIGGWGRVILAKKRPSYYLNRTSCHSIDSTSKLFKLSFEQGNRLFITHNWPPRFKPFFRDLVEGTPAFARNACRRIDHFIKTNGAE